APFGMLEWEWQEGIVGAPLWGDDVNVWIQRSPLFHLSSIRTPIRFEFEGAYLPAYWEDYATLKRMRRPVEMVHIPDEVHEVQTPWGRYTSQENTVDWFDFWLNGSEDPDPTKNEQYTRWEHLCDLQRSENPGRPTFCVPG